MCFGLVVGVVAEAASASVSALLRAFRARLWADLDLEEFEDVEVDESAFSTLLALHMRTVLSSKVVAKPSSLVCISSSE